MKFVFVFTFLLSLGVLPETRVVFAYGSAESFINAMRHDILLVTGKTFHPLIERQRDNLGVTVLLHFSSSVAEHKKYIDSVYNEAAKELKGMIRFTAVDCNEWIMFCKETHNPDLKYPTVLVYPPNRILPPDVLVPTPDKKTLMTTALSHVPGQHVDIVTSKNIDEFITQHIAMPKILLFSPKLAPPVLFKALGNAFTDRILFGFIPSNETALEQRYGITKRPTIILVRTGAKKPEVYQGQSLTFTDLHDWINVHAETFVKGGGFSAEDIKSAEVSPKPWLVQKVPEITGPSHQDVCLRGGSGLCVIYLSSGKPSEEEMKMLETLADEYPDSAERGAKFRWGWLDVSVEKPFAELFEVSKFPSIVALNPHRRLRYARLSDDKEASQSTIRDLLEKIVSGDGRFTVIKSQKLPSFAARVNDTKAKKDEL